MKTALKSTSALLALLLLLSALASALIGCGNGKGTPNPTDSTSDSVSETTTTAPSEDGTGTKPIDPPDGPVTPAEVEYTVSVKTISGRAVSDLRFFIYQDDKLTTYGITDKNGIGTVKLPTASNYTVELDAYALEGYTLASRYEFTGNAANIVLTSSVISDTDLTGVSYRLGDIMHDFTVTTTDGTKFTLSEVLKTKKAVLINFFYTTCSPCINEFPYLEEAYQLYKDDIEVIALNNYPSDNEYTVRSFKDSMGLTFPVAKDFSALGTAFSLQGYPTSVIIDRYGTICLIEVGGLTSAKPFIAAFDHFSADNYEQKLFEFIEELTPTEKPNVQMPSSEDIGAALNGDGFTATYVPETEATDAEYSWPFLVGEKDGKPCIYPANSKKDSSFATIHAMVELKAGQALAIDWFASCELGADLLYILVNDKDIYRLSGISEDWVTCYPYVATEDGTYKVSFIYLKDDGNDVGEDCIWLRNFRIVDASAVDTETYIPRQAATNPNANGLGYQNYVTVVYNPADGYYHVGTENGPLLLVNLMGATQLSDTSLNLLGYNGELILSNENLYDKLVNFCNYSINGNLYGYCPVTEELKDLLEKAASIVGFELDNPNQWLQACSYYDAYGTDKQLEDPVVGLAPFSAFTAVESTGDEDTFNTVTYDGRVIMPRGFLYAFTPAASGVYLIKSQSKNEVNGWIFNANYEIIHTAEYVDRPFDGKAPDTTNVSMIIYMEAGTTYYIDIAYYDIYAAGSFTFTLRYLAESYQHFHIASPGYYTYYETSSGQINETIAGGIDVILDTDGYYHEKRADGSIGSIVYADFTIPTALFSHSIEAMIDLYGFNFALSDTDLQVLAKLSEFGDDKEKCKQYYVDLWADTYEENADLYKLDEVLAGIYHGDGEDLTDEISAYLDKKMTAEDAPELAGCVPVDAALAELLQKLVDKYSLKGVDHSWTKLCYYYKALGPEA